MVRQSEWQRTCHQFYNFQTTGLELNLVLYLENWCDFNQFTCCLFTCCECAIPSINQCVQSVHPSRWHNLKAFSLVSFHLCSFFLFLFSRSTCHSLFMKTFAYFWVVAVVICIVKTKVLVNWIAGSHLGCLESLLFWRCHFLSWKAVCWRYVFAILFLDQHSFVVRLTELLYGTLICNCITII